MQGDTSTTASEGLSRSKRRRTDTSSARPPEGDLLPQLSQEARGLTRATGDNRSGSLPDDARRSDIVRSIEGYTSNIGNTRKRKRPADEAGQSQPSRSGRRQELPASRVSAARPLESYMPDEAEESNRASEGLRSHEQEPKKKQPQLHQMVRTYLWEHHGVYVPSQEAGQSFVNIDTMLERAKEEAREQGKNLDYLKRDTLEAKARRYYYVTKVKPEEHPDGYETGDWLPSDDKRARQEKKRDIAQKAANDGDLVRDYVDEIFRIYVEKTEGRKRNRSVQQVLERAQEQGQQELKDKDLREDLRDLTVEDVLDAAKTWENEGNLVRDYLKEVSGANVPRQEEMKVYRGPKQVLERAQQEHLSLRGQTLESVLGKAEAWEREGNLVRAYLEDTHEIDIPSQEEIQGEMKVYRGPGQVLERAQQEHSSLGGQTLESVLNAAKVQRAAQERLRGSEDERAPQERDEQHPRDPFQQEPGFPHLPQQGFEASSSSQMFPQGFEASSSSQMFPQGFDVQMTDSPPPLPLEELLRSALGRSDEPAGMTDLSGAPIGKRRPPMPPEIRTSFDPPAPVARQQPQRDAPEPQPEASHEDEASESEQFYPPLDPPLRLKSPTTEKVYTKKYKTNYLNWANKTNDEARAGKPMGMLDEQGLPVMRNRRPITYKLTPDGVFRAENYGESPAGFENVSANAGKLQEKRKAGGKPKAKSKRQYDEANDLRDLLIERFGTDVPPATGGRKNKEEFRTFTAILKKARSMDPDNQELREAKPDDLRDELKARALLSAKFGIEVSVKKFTTLPAILEETKRLQRDNKDLQAITTPEELKKLARAHAKERASSPTQQEETSSAVHEEASPAPIQEGGPDFGLQERLLEQNRLLRQQGFGEPGFGVPQIFGGQPDFGEQRFGEPPILRGQLGFGEPQGFGGPPIFRGQPGFGEPQYEGYGPYRPGEAEASGPPSHQPESSQKKGRDDIRQWVRTYVKEHQKYDVPRINPDTKVALSSVKDILAYAKDKTKDRRGNEAGEKSLDYLKEESVKSKARDYHAAKDNPEEYPDGYLTDDDKPEFDEYSLY